MKTNSKILLSVLIFSILAFPTIAADNSGTTGGVTLGTHNTINLCTKVIPASGNWGMCDGRTTHGTFSWEPSGPHLNFNAEASNLGSGGLDYPEVSNLRVVGVTTSTITWAWTTPDRTYFKKNLVTVKRTDNGAIVYPETAVAIDQINKPVFKMISGLETGVSYTITVVSNYNDIPTDTSYTLIYYRDSDPDHGATTLPVIRLAQSNSVSGIVSFSGYLDTHQSIPFKPEDVNDRGKIWIVPTSRILPGGFIDWTGYAVGQTLPDMLFEEDESINPSVSGGITYTYTS